MDRLGLEYSGMGEERGREVETERSQEYIGGEERSSRKSVTGAQLRGHGPGTGEGSQEIPLNPATKS